MKMKIVRSLLSGVITLGLSSMWYFGLFEQHTMAQVGPLVLVLLLLALFVAKGFTPFPPYFVICVNCGLLPLSLGIPLCIFGHMLGQVVSLSYGTASLGKTLPPFMRGINEQSSIWKIILCYCFMLPTDVTLLLLHNAKVQPRKALLCGLPFIVVANTIIVISGKGIVALVRALVETTV